MKGKTTFTELFDAPFRQLHEIYKIIYDKSEAQRIKDEEEKKKQEEEEKAKQKAKGKPILNRMPPPDAKRIESKNDTSSLSPLEAEVMSDALEELVEGGL